MKYSAFSLFFTLQFMAEIHAQNVSGARMAALSGSAITQSDSFAGFNNLSASAQSDGRSYAFFGQTPYGISEIKDAGVSILQHLGTGVMGVVFRSYGNTEFSRQRMNLGYALPLSDKFKVSSSIGYSSTRISNGYGKAHTLWANIGATYDVRKDWKWAAVIDLPVSALKNVEEQPATLRIGTTYSFGEQVALSAQVISTTNAQSSVSYSFGLEYFPTEVLAVRFGMNTFWQTWSLGVGTRWKNYSFDASAVLHPQLGLTPQISLTYEMEK
jgi:hypothetical protein